MATALLRRAADLEPVPRLTAMLTVGLSTTEPPLWTGHLTFWSEHDGEEPYYLLDDVDQEVAALVLTWPMPG